MLNTFRTWGTSQGLKLTCQLTGPLGVLDFTSQNNFGQSSDIYWLNPYFLHSVFPRSSLAKVAKNTSPGNQKWLFYFWLVTWLSGVSSPDKRVLFLTNSLRMNEVCKIKYRHRNFICNIIMHVLDYLCCLFHNVYENVHSGVLTLASTKTSSNYPQNISGYIVKVVWFKLCVLLWLLCYSEKTYCTTPTYFTLDLLLMKMPMTPLGLGYTSGTIEDTF